MLDELTQQYRESLSSRIETIKGLIEQVREGNSNAEDELRVIAHSLHGSGSTYGFPRISEAARDVEYADNEVLLPNLVILIRVLMEYAINPLEHRAVSESESAGTPLILLIEDDPDIYNLFKHLLEAKSDSYKLMVASSATVALELLNSHEFSLVILDLVLPDSDGRSLLPEIVSRCGQNVPVFILSSVDVQQIRQECLNLGASRYFTKPFDPSLIADTIDQFFRGDAGQGAATPSKNATKAREAGNTESVSSTPDRDQTILVAEDDELVANIISHRLKREGLDIEHVQDGESALNAVMTRVFSLIILDIKMPVIDGFEVLQNIRENSSLRNVPVIMLTAMGSEKDIVRGYELGANDYILKPFSPVELIARVKSFLKPAERQDVN